MFMSLFSEVAVRLQQMTCTILVVHTYIPICFTIIP